VVGLDILDNPEDTNMRVISVKYVSPTNTRPTRFKASDNNGNTATISFRYELNMDGRYQAAADALREKMGWKSPIIASGEQFAGYYVFILADYT